MPNYILIIVLAVLVPTLFFLIFPKAWAKVLKLGREVVELLKLDYDEDPDGLVAPNYPSGGFMNSLSKSMRIPPELLVELRKEEGLTFKDAEARVQQFYRDNPTHPMAQIRIDMLGACIKSLGDLSR